MHVYKDRKVTIRLPKCRTFDFTTWIDTSDALFYVNMELLHDYMVNEAPRVCWDYDDHCGYGAFFQDAYNELSKIHRFYLHHKKYVKKLEDKYLMQDWEGNGSIWHIYEEQLHHLETQMLNRLIEVRGFLWS